MSVRTFPARPAHFADYVQRLLPQRDLRTIGPWCFFDHFGPADDGGFVRPHPHVGLQTVTWLFSGQGRHGDSLGFEQVIRPGQLNLMTAGNGIVHWEAMDNPTSEPLHGVQLWVALPDHRRHGEPDFEHHERLPRLTLGQAELIVFMGALGTATSPASTHWPMCGVEIRLPADGTASLPLDPGWEYGFSVVEGGVSLADGTYAPGTLVQLDPSDSDEGDHMKLVAGPDGARIILVGGAPFEAPVLIWWNFVARTPDEMTEAHARWPEGFGEVDSWEGEPMPIPPLPRLANPE